MSQVVWHITMSLDGFIAGPDDSMEWAFRSFGSSGPSRVADDVMGTTGAILAGRRMTPMTLRSRSSTAP